MIQGEAYCDGSLKLAVETHLDPGLHLVMNFVLSWGGAAGGEGPASLPDSARAVCRRSSDKVKVPVSSATARRRSIAAGGPDPPLPVPASPRRPWWEHRTVLVGESISMKSDNAQLTAERLEATGEGGGRMTSEEEDDRSER